jgi:hypothetical protein
MLLCYNYQNGIIDEEEDIIFAIEPRLFSIGIISLFETIQSMKTIVVEFMDNYGETSTSNLNFGVQNIEKKIIGNKYEPKVALKDKVYSETYYNHQRGSVIVDETPTKIKAHEF